MINICVLPSWCGINKCINTMPTDEILIETRRLGGILRVLAIHVASGVEVVFQAPATTTHFQIKKLAADKIRYVLTKK